MSSGHAAQCHPNVPDQKPRLGRGAAQQPGVAWQGCTSRQLLAAYRACESPVDLPKRWEQQWQVPMGMSASTQHLVYSARVEWPIPAAGSEVRAGFTLGAANLELCRTVAKCRLEPTLLGLQSGGTTAWLGIRGTLFSIVDARRLNSIVTRLDLLLCSRCFALHNSTNTHRASEFDPCFLRIVKFSFCINLLAEF